MGWLGKLLGGTVGFALGGPLGAVAGVAFAVLMLVVQSRDPRAWGRVGPESGEQYFFPSLARTATGDFIPARSLMMDRYCQECHQDVHDSWAVSAHRFASFNNPAYLFSVRGTPSTRATELTAKLSSSWVCLNSWFRTTWGTASFFSSMTRRMP